MKVLSCDPQACINAVTHTTSPFTFFLRVGDWIDRLDTVRLRIETVLRYLKSAFQIMLDGKGLKKR